MVRCSILIRWCAVVWREVFYIAYIACEYYTIIGLRNSSAIKQRSLKTRLDNSNSNFCKVDGSCLDMNYLLCDRHGRVNLECSKRLYLKMLCCRIQFFFKCLGIGPPFCVLFWLKDIFMFVCRYRYNNSKC